jgi:hypothetical protein
MDLVFKKVYLHILIQEEVQKVNSRAKVGIDHLLKNITLDLKFSETLISSE